MNVQGSQTGYVYDTPQLLFEVQQAKTSYDVFLVFKKVISNLSYKAFYALSQLPSEEIFRLSDLLVITNLDQEFIREAEEIEVVRHTPVFDQVKGTILPVVWTLEIFDTYEDQLKTARVKNLYKKYGFTSGVTFPTTSSQGIRGAVGFLGSRMAPDQNEMMELSFFVIHAFDKITGVKKEDVHRIPSLTEQEITCIRWAAAGKTVSETALILSLSEYTVVRYLSNASMKLNTVNKAHTVATAIRHGIISM